MESVTTENLKVKISANYNFTLDVDNKKYSRRSDFKICEILQSSIVNYIFKFIYAYEPSQNEMFKQLQEY
ncbi:14304_t:CDS:2 [Entrophospora sp. SA101]|nr:14513_t:CDS:2 [Entrophospora sp. SA101]CAJ0833412.1 14304_t:CDS:2 [Entrophospora sp. SA101]